VRTRVEGHVTRGEKTRLRDVQAERTRDRSDVDLDKRVGKGRGDREHDTNCRVSGAAATRMPWRERCSWQHRTLVRREPVGGHDRSEGDGRLAWGIGFREPYAALSVCRAGRVPP